MSFSYPSSHIHFSSSNTLFIHFFCLLIILTSSTRNYYHLVNLKFSIPHYLPPNVGNNFRGNPEKLNRKLFALNLTLLNSILFFSYFDWQMIFKIYYFFNIWKCRGQLSVNLVSTTGVGRVNNLTKDFKWNNSTQLVESTVKIPQLSIQH